VIGLVDYNMGNLSSVLNAFDKIDEKIELVSKPDDIKNYDRLILPGVGAFADAMEHLKENSLDKAIKEYAQSGRYILGICLGMQLLFDSSEEFSKTDGLGLIDGTITYFDKSKLDGHKVPHMGWNKIFFKDNTIFSSLSNSEYLYFVHSLHANTNENNIIGTTTYGYEFVSAVNKDNIYGIQPHPEKSHEKGLKVLKNFAQLK
jgi:glutamine amidotransferase